MKTITKKYTFTEEEALAHATFYGWKDKSVDESLLDENGNVPLVDKLDDEGNVIYLQKIYIDENDVETYENVLDEIGNPTTIKEPLNVYIDNPQTPLDFLSMHFDGFIKEWFLAPAKRQAEIARKQAEVEAKNATASMITAIEEGVKAKISTVIE